MSTRSRPRSSTTSIDDDDLSMSSNHSGAGLDGKRRSSANKSPKRVQRRVSRMPRSLVDASSFALASTMDEEEAHNSIRSHRSSGNLLEEGRRERTRNSTTMRRKRSQSTNSMRQNRTLGVSARGGERNRVVSTDDDNWQMFREALQNMA